MAGLGSIGLNTGIYMFDMNRQYRISWFWDYLYAASDKIFRYLIPTGDQLKILYLEIELFSRYGA